jgi:3-oxoacid CoA-transferase subunit B
MAQKIHPDSTSALVDDHVAKDGSAKFRRACTLPLTGMNVVDMIITDLAVFERRNRQSSFELTECAPGTSADRIRENTEASHIAGQPV